MPHVCFPQTAVKLQILQGKTLFPEPHNGAPTLALNSWTIASTFKGPNSARKRRDTLERKQRRCLTKRKAIRHFITNSRPKSGKIAGRNVTSPNKTGLLKEHQEIYATTKEESNKSTQLNLSLSIINNTLLGSVHVNSRSSP